MGYILERSTIEEQFETAWAERTPIYWDNDPRTPPVDGTAWVRLVVRPGASAQKGLGDVKLVRYAGAVMVQIFTPIGSATREAMELADALIEVFSLKQIGGLLFRSADVQVLGEQQGWFQTNVSFSFQRDEQQG